MPVIVGSETQVTVPGVGPRLAATPTPNGTPPSVRVDVAGFGQSVTTVLLSRLNGDGTTVPVRQPVALIRGAGTIFDAEVPFGQPVSYFETDTGASTDAVVLDADEPWLVNPFRPGDSIPLEDLDDGAIEQSSMREWELPSARVLVQPYGPRSPIVVTTGGRRQRTSQLVCLTFTRNRFEQLSTLVGTDEVLFLNVPGDRALRARTGYISVGGVKYEFLGDADDLTAEWALPFDEVGYPFGSVSPAWNLDSFDEVFGSIDDLPVAYRSLENAELNVRRDLGVPAG